MHENFFNFLRACDKYTLYNAIALNTNENKVGYFYTFGFPRFYNPQKDRERSF